MRRLVAELIGAFVLVFGGCGSAVFSAAFPNVGIGLLGVSLAFGLCTAKRFAWKDLPGYVAAQVLGAALASFALLVLLKNGPTGYDAAVGGLAANGFGDHSPGHFGMGAALAAEVILTFIFMTVILGATSKRAIAGFAGIPIGLTLTLVHLIGIPITNLSVNPARSTGPALFVGGWALEQLWLFSLAPIAGAAIAGVVGHWLHEDDAKA